MPYTKININYKLKNINVKYKTIEVLEENIEKFQVLGLGKYFKIWNQNTT